MKQIWTTSIGKQQGIDLLNAHAQWYCNDIEPTTTYPFQNWADTGNNLWKQRNAENTTWIVRGKLSEAFFGLAPLSEVYTKIESDNKYYTKIESDDLFAPKTGDSEQTFSVAASIFPNHAVNLGQFTNSLVENGYQVLPSGWIIQWGTYGRTGGPLPIAFPNACLAHAFSVIEGDGNAFSTSEMRTSVSATTVGSFARMVTIRIIAIGY